MPNFNTLMYFLAMRKNTVVVLLTVLTILILPQFGTAQWLDWADETTTRLTVTSVANSDPEEKDMWNADLNNDGKEDLIVVRKQPFSSSTQPGKSNLLLMNINGILTDQTSIYAPQFISNVNFARDVFVGDFDNDGWKDVVIANTFNQQPTYYRNLGNNAGGTWLGLIDESSTRFPLLTEDTPLFCAVWGGDVTGDGAMDIYFVNYKPNSGGGTAKDFLLVNNGNGVFANESQTRLGSLRNSAFGTAVQIADMDNDGDNDIVKNTTLYSVAPWNSRGVILLFNNGTGNFSTWQNIAPAASPYMFEIADFNLDGKKDLYVVDDGSDYLITINTITPNTNVTFTKTLLSFSTSNGFGGNVHAADLDIDGDMDIVVADVDVDIPPCASGRRMAIYRNDNGVFSNPYGTTVFPWATNAYDQAILDINSDGLKDFVIGKCSGYGVFMSDNCGLAPSPADYDLDGLPDACDPCPTNPDPNCAPPTNYPTADLTKSIARQWNEILLGSIRKDFARPTVHARNLFHISAAMWDAWSAYGSSDEFLLGKTIRNFSCPLTGLPTSTNIEDDRKKAISYAAYRLLKHRFQNSPQVVLLNQGFDVHMDSLGYDKTFTSTVYTTGDARALGNYIAQCYINFGLQDGSNEQNGYANTSYAPVNPPMNVDVAGNPTIVDYNRWQPLTLDLFIDQSGNPIPGATPPHLTPEWGKVIPFALDSSDMTVNTRNGFNYNVYHDPGAPPTLQMDGAGTSDQYKYGFALVSTWSSHLDPTDNVMWDISPATQGNRTNLPTSPLQYPSFYDQLNGGTTNVGYSVNPKTGQPYTPNMVPRGDYARVLAEFWADGPDSETPPGHWFTLFNYVSDHPQQTKKYKGQGNTLNDLEWDVKGYFLLGGALHDVAITAWGMKGWYDYIRPISAIRGMAALGQSTNTGGPNYHPAGIPLIPGYIELVAAGDPLANGSVNIGKVKLKAWRGHSFINNVDTDEAGVGWILAENWLPYQRPSFVSPPFAGFISGHSTYSRAAAEVLTDFTGDRYFPGGLGEFTAPQNQFLVFEDGPSVNVTLQWATYQDASDESSMSRIWGGIHPPCDDIPGRIIGVTIADDAFVKAEKYFFPCQSALQISSPNNVICAGSNTTLTALPGFNYQWYRNGIAQVGANSNTFIASSNGTYYCQITGAGCSGNSNSIIITVTNNPNATISYSTPLSFCAPGSVMLMSSSFSGVTYQWQKNGIDIINATNQSYQAVSNGSYRVKQTANACYKYSSAVTTTTASSVSATIIANGPTNFCSGGNVVLNVSNAITGYNYQWKNNGANIAGATFNSYTATNAGNYTCTVAATCGTATSNIINVSTGTITAMIIPAGTITICSGAFVSLSSNTGTGYTYQWKFNGNNINGATSAGYNAFAAGNYSVEINSPCGSSTSTVMSINIAPPTATMMPSGNVSICAGSGQTFTANPGYNYSYQWFRNGVALAGATNQTYSNNSSGQYSVRVTQGGVCSVTSSITQQNVINNPNPVITPLGPTTFCNGQNVVLSANTYAGVQYQWQKNGNNIAGATGQNYTATTFGSYKVRQTFAGCVKTSSSLNVTVNCRNAFAQNLSDQINESNIRAYPNPFNEYIKISEMYALKKYSIVLTDAAGRIIIQETKTDEGSEFMLRTKHIKSGIYFLKITTNAESQMVKMIKQ